MEKYLVKSVSQIDLTVFFESLDGQKSFVDKHETFDSWFGQVRPLMKLAAEQGLEEPVVEVEVEW